MLSEFLSFYHIPPYDEQKVLDMDYETFSRYYQSIDVIRTRDTMSGVLASTYPHQKKQGQDKTWKELSARAYPVKQNKNILSSEDAAAHIAKMMGGN